MPKNLGTGSHISTPEGEPDLVGPDTTEEPLPVADGGSEEHGTGSESLSVVVTHVDDDGKPAAPSGPSTTPRHTSTSRSHPQKARKSDDD